MFYKLYTNWQTNSKSESVVKMRWCTEQQKIANWNSQVTIYDLQYTQKKKKTLFVICNLESG